MSVIRIASRKPPLWRLTRSPVPVQMRQHWVVQGHWEASDQSIMELLRTMGLMDSFFLSIGVFSWNFGGV